MRRRVAREPRQGVFDVSDPSPRVERARSAYATREWVSARELFTEAAREAELEPADLYALSNCAWWLGMVDEALRVQEHAYRRFLAAGDRRAAALVALDHGYTRSLRGEPAQASGWLRRAVRLLEREPPCPEQAFLVYLEFEEALGASELEVALDRAREVRAAGERFGDANLTALGVLGEGRVMVRQGQVVDGLALLDEAMVAAVGGELDPAWAGNIYCHLMLTCYELADIRRAGEWTEATARWCSEMPGAGPFLGICRVHRAQTLAVLGAWDAAEDEAHHVCADFAGFHVAIVAEAHYQLGEIRRQRGALEAAEAAYVEAHRLGRDPQPGLALLRLAQRRVPSAVSAVVRALADERDPLTRARHLPAAVEILLAAGDVARARTYAEELARIATRYGTAGLHAAACAVEGAVVLADSPQASLEPLQRALELWQDLRAPYEVARTRLLLAHAHDRAGDPDAADLERAAAAEGLASLGARAHPGPARPPAPRGDGLTERQAEILDLVAEGRSNQDIADALYLSVRTVERHLATAYQKLGVRGRSARAAAVRHAVEQRARPTTS